LIVRANLVVSAEALIDQVWGEESLEVARNVLQTYASRCVCPAHDGCTIAGTKERREA
jgi:hypothetical protein